MAADLPPSSARWFVWIENGSLWVTYALGALLAALASWPLVFVYLACCVLCNVLYAALICPYCFHHAEKNCHSGYHHISRFFRAQPDRTFAGQFRRYVAVMVPVWALPPIAALCRLLVAFSWLQAALLAAFCVLGFMVVPYTSQHNCERCGTVDCPRRKVKSAPHP